MTWASIDEILPIINDARNPHGTWSWARNSRCKYISLRIDMRSGDCIIKDSDGEVITLEQLKYQVTLEKEKQHDN